MRYNQWVSSGGPVRPMAGKENVNGIERPMDLGYWSRLGAARRMKFMSEVGVLLDLFQRKRREREIQRCFSYIFKRTMGSRAGIGEVGSIQENFGVRRHHYIPGLQHGPRRRKRGSKEN